jgi:hypothetical protein
VRIETRVAGQSLHYSVYDKPGSIDQGVIVENKRSGHRSIVPAARRFCVTKIVDSKKRELHRLKNECAKESHADHLSGAREKYMSGVIDRLAGVWRLISAEAEIQGSGEHVPVMGASPSGRLFIMSSGIMMVILTDGRGVPKSTENRSIQLAMSAHYGHLKIDGDQFTTDVDISSHEALLHTPPDSYVSIRRVSVGTHDTVGTPCVSVRENCSRRLLWERESST